METRAQPSLSISRADISAIEPRRDLNRGADLNAVALRRLIRHHGNAAFEAGWRNVIMMHYRVDPKFLQRVAPFELDCSDGAAYVSLVAFRMEHLRWRRAGHAGRLLLRPIASHEFLNVRTYVRHRGEPGIFFLAEWLPNRLSVALGPPVFGLPYRLGRLRYECRADGSQTGGMVTDRISGASLRYEVGSNDDEALVPPDSGSLDEFLMERYTAFTYWRGLRRCFRIWHAPWPQRRVQLSVTDAALLNETGAWAGAAEYLFAQASPGFARVLMSGPRSAHRLLPGMEL